MVSTSSEVGVKGFSMWRGGRVLDSGLELCCGLLAFLREGDVETSVRKGKHGGQGNICPHVLTTSWSEFPRAPAFSASLDLGAHCLDLTLLLP